MARSLLVAFILVLVINVLFAKLLLLASTVLECSKMLICLIASLLLIAATTSRAAGELYTTVTVIISAGNKVHVVWDL